MGNFSNGLTDAELERLAKLAEECGEVVQIVNKIIAHGYASSHPENPLISNRSVLEREIGDIHNAVELMTAKSDIDTAVIGIFARQKAPALLKYMHHQE